MEHDQIECQVNILRNSTIKKNLLRKSREKLTVLVTIGELIKSTSVVDNLDLDFWLWTGHMMILLISIIVHIPVVFVHHLAIVLVFHHLILLILLLLQQTITQQSRQTALNLLVGLLLVIDLFHIQTDGLLNVLVYGEPFWLGSPHQVLRYQERQLVRFTHRNVRCAHGQIQIVVHVEGHKCQLILW